MNSNVLAQIGRCASDATWKTPLYRTYQVDEPQRSHYMRLNDMAQGRALLERLAVLGLVIVGTGVKVDKPSAPL